LGLFGPAKTESVPVPDAGEISETESVPVPDAGEISVPVPELGENLVPVPELESKWEYNLTLNCWFFMKRFGWARPNWALSRCRRPIDGALLSQVVVGSTIVGDFTFWTSRMIRPL
jgi:hypothetical protein